MKEIILVISVSLLVLLSGCMTQPIKQPELQPEIGTSDYMIQVIEEGDTIKANFIKPVDKDVYVIGTCFTPTGWKLYEKNELEQWVPTPSWYRDSSICAAECENNESGRATCNGICPPETFGCQKLGYAALFEWNKKFYELKEGTCGDIQDSFIFINQASTGQYKLQYHYFKDSECATPKFAEKIITIE